MSQSPACHRRALIVEDEFILALDLEDAVSQCGFDVCDLASTADRARSLAMDHCPDLVVMDVNLSGGREGIDAARWLHDVCGAPIVFVTSYTDANTVKRINERVPGAPVLSKPVHREQFGRAVAEVAPTA